MSSQSRIELYKEAMVIEQERASLQAKIDKLQARLNQIQGSLFSADVTPTVSTASIGGAVQFKGSVKTGRKVRAARGELKQRVLEALAAAGPGGIRVRDLAVALGAKQEALHSWFQYARKHVKAIRKAGKGRYRLAGTLPEAAPAPAKVSAAAKPVKKGAGKQQRGRLSESIQEALKSAGKDGVRVGDLAKKLGINSRNLYVWFATTGKKFKAIKKVSPGQYALQA